MSEVPLLDLQEITKEYPAGGSAGRFFGKRKVVHALDGVTLAIARGETLGLVGESGSGKSTLGRVALGLIEPTSGSVHVDGQDLGALTAAALRGLRRRMQMVFQDPYSSMDPRASIESSLHEPLIVHSELSREDRRAEVRRALERVGMAAADLRRLPHEFSGGQLQRLALARALCLDPDLLVLDEPVSSLDVSTQAGVINLLEELQRELGLTYLFIAHDLALVRHASHRIAVMYLGRLVEVGTASDVYERPKHPYTQALLSAAPVPDPVAQRARRRIVLHGEMPTPIEPPSGCRFHTRCPHAMDRCRVEDPPPFVAPDGSVVHCHLHEHGPRLGGASVASLTVPA